MYVYLPLAQEGLFIFKHFLFDVSIFQKYFPHKNHRSFEKFNYTRNYTFTDVFIESKLCVNMQYQCLKKMTNYLGK